MGVPSFYKWLVGKYPNIVVPAKDDVDESSSAAAGEAAGPPNGVYHNLYLDMNCIIHPCFHPEDQVCRMRLRQTTAHISIEDRTMTAR
jgi:5'-3' exoribonuclease 2